jgi:RHS repeat-associated protein
MLDRDSIWTPPPLPASGFACFIQDHPYLAAIWNFGDGVSTALFGGGRAPFSVMALAILAGLFVGRPRARRRVCSWRGRLALALSCRGRPALESRVGCPRHARTGCPRHALPLWRRVVLTSLTASVFLSSNPQAAYAGTPVYDPVFYYYHPDNLGSSQLMTDRDGDVVQQYGYTPFGKENYKNNTLAFSVSSRYTGQTLDEETGLYYYGARYYDPELARFIQADSAIPDLEFSQAYNRYAYVYNNPLKFSDPTGQLPFLVAAALIGAAVGGGSAAAAGGNFGDILKGAFIGALTSVISAGVAAAVGEMAVVAGCSATAGSVAGAVAGFAASYGANGLVSGDWHFTIMDAVNLGIAVWSACQVDPRPGAEATLGEGNGQSLQKTSGDSGTGGVTLDKQDVIVFVNENIQNLGLGTGSTLSQEQAMQIGKAIAGKGQNGRVFTFETPDDITTQLKELKLDKAVDIVVVAHGRAGGIVRYDVGLSFETGHWKNIAKQLRSGSRIHLVSCSTAAGKEGARVLTEWSKATMKFFSAYDVNLRYKGSDPFFKMAGQGRLSITFGGGPLVPQPENVKYFWDMYKKK